MGAQITRFRVESDRPGTLEYGVPQLTRPTTLAAGQHPLFSRGDPKVSTIHQPLVRCHPPQGRDHPSATSMGPPRRHSCRPTVMLADRHGGCQPLGLRRVRDGSDAGDGDGVWGFCRLR